MPPKQAGRNRGEETKEEPLQAVVVADTFETRFAPLTADRPRCLLPLANTPLIEYTLEYLASAGVQDVFFYPGAHIDQVETYLNESKWTSKSSPFRSLEILKCMATSVGDIMRDLDQKELVQGDFVCVSGDIVSDFPLQKALKVHKLRRQKDANAVMTMLLREASTSDRAHKQMTPTFVIDPAQDRCLYYEETPAGSPFGIHIDTEMLHDILKKPELDIRQDLIDCRIDICTKGALTLWSDNFDNQKPRTDFLSRALKDSLNDKTIHTYIIEGHYANRVSDLSAYAAITADTQAGIIGSLRLTNNVTGTQFRQQRRRIFKENNVIVQRSAQLSSGSVVGENTSIGAGSKIHRSVIGRRCNIGKKTEIDSAYIWDDITIGNNVKIDRAIVGSEVFVGDNCEIGEGTLIGFGTNIPPGTKIVPGKRVHAKTNFKLLDGVNGHSQENEMYESDDDTTDYDSSWTRSMYQQPNLAESTSSIASDMSEMSEPTSTGGSRSQSFATHASDEDGTERFQQDTVAILSQRMQDGKHVDDMQSELMGLRFSGGADEAQVRKAVAAALTRHMQAEISAGKSAQEASKRTLEQYRNLIRRQNAEQSTEEQVIFLVEAQTDLSKRSDGTKIMPFFVKDLYAMDVFEEDTFTSWYEDERSQESSIASIRRAAAPFMEWLAEADEESEEDEDDDE